VPVRLTVWRFGALAGAGRNISANAGEFGLPKSTAITIAALDWSDLVQDRCGKRSLQVAAASLGNIW
jgi:hypothetical protein